MIGEDYLLDIIYGRKTGLVPSLIKFCLTLLAQIYRLIIYLRKKVYDWGLKESTTLDARVISVGNITVGGTGKTPLVKRLALDLEEAGYKVAVLSRGYKGEFGGEVGVVSDGESILMSPQEAGDEPYLLAQALESGAVLVGASRKETGAYACDNFGPDYILLDDGFQHWQVERDYDIVALDAVHPFGGAELLPGGLLREPLTSLKRADKIVLTRADQVSGEELEEISTKLEEINVQAEVLLTKHQPTYLRDLISGQKEAVDIKGERIISAAGIGNPRSFELTLAELGAQIAKKMRYEDHHSYTEEDINRLFTLATVHDVDRIITTEKDAVSMDREVIELNNVGIKMQALGIELKTLAEDEDWQDLLEEVE